MAKKKRISYPALLVTQNKHRFFFATIPVDDLFPYCFVSRRDEDPEAGFQRALNESRANDISEYLAAGSGSIPSNVVLSAQEDAGFSYDRSTKSVSFDPASGAFLVLDGQHRLWGYQKCLVRHRVPVAIYQGLTRGDEAKLFIDINTTQRGVPAALLLDIKHLAQIESTRESTLRMLFDRLNSEASSPLVGRMSAAASITGKISRVTFNRAVAPLFNGGVMLEASPSDRYKLLENYLNAFDAELPDKSLLTRASFFEGAMEMFETIVQQTLSISRNAKKNSIQKTVSSLARLDYRGSGGRTVLDKREVVALMQSALRTTRPILSEML